MSDIKIDIPDITVSIVPDHEYITSVTPSEVYQVNVNAGDIYSVNLQQPDIIVADGSSSVYDMAQLAGYAFYAGTASFATTASYVEAGTVSSASYAAYAFSAGTASYVSGSAITSWNNVQQKPTGLVSSSTQASQWTVLSSSYAVSASYVIGDAGVTDWSEITNKPSGIVSSSTQVNYTQLQNIPSGIVSSSEQTINNIAGKEIHPSGITASIQTNQVKINTDGSNVYLSASIVTGVYNETRIINPPIPVINFSGASIEYTAQRVSDIRSGLVIGSWSGSTTTYTDVSNTDIGNTEDLSFSLIKIGDNIRLRALSVGSGSGTWTIQFLFKLFPNLL